MATAGPSKLPSVSDHTEPAQSYRSPDDPRQPSSCRAGSPKSQRGLSLGESITRIPSPERSNRRYSQVYSSKSPSRSSSPDSSPASSVKEANVTAKEVKEPESGLPKAPEYLSRVFSVPKALFHIDETNREWRFSFAPTQDVHVLLMELNKETVRREKAEQEVRTLTQRLSSEPGPEIQPSEHQQKGPEAEKVPASKRLFIKKRDARRQELVENKDNKPLDERFDELVDWSEQVEADIDAAQDRNTLLFDDLGEASKKINKLKSKKKVLKADKARLEKELEQSRNQTASGRDSPLQAEGKKGKGAACRTTMANEDRISTVPSKASLQPLASQTDQENRLAELERENERLRQENDEMRNALEQLQNEGSPPEGPESQISDANPEEAQVRSAEPRVEVLGADVEMGGVTTGQDSTAPQNIKAPVMPVIPPAASEAGEILRFDLQRLLSSINRYPKRNSDDARRRRDSRRHERRRRQEQRRLEGEEEAQRQQQRRSERKDEALRPRKHRHDSRKVYPQKKKTLSPLGWMRYLNRPRTLMDLLSFTYMFPRRLSYRSG